MPIGYNKKALVKKKKKNYNPLAKGFTFEEEIKRSFTHLIESTNIGTMWWERIWDTKDYINKYCPICKSPLGRCASCGKKLPTLGMKTPKRKGDFHCVINGVYILIECKATGVKNGFESSMITDYQMLSLLENQMAGAVSIFMIKSTHSKSKRVYVVDAMSLEKELQFHKFISWDNLLKISLITLERIPYHGLPYYNLKWVFKISNEEGVKID